MNMSKTTQFTIVNTTEISGSEKVFVNGFASRVVGQPAALSIAQLAYRSARNPLRDRTRPIGIYYLVGPSRTGKSLTGEVLAELFHGRREALTRIQASDYEQDHQILDIKGAPPSYIGYRDPQDAKNRLEPDEVDPSSIISTHNLKRVKLGSKERVDIIVIEEFEKSSYDFYKLWMGVFDKGKLKMANSQTVDFTNTIFVLTSNLATDELEKMASGGIGFGSQPKILNEDDVKSVVDRAMMRRYKKEFRNRLDAVVIFKPLTMADMTNVIDAEIRLLGERIFLQMTSSTYFELCVEPSAKFFLLARSGTEVAVLKRVLNSEVLMPLGRLLDDDNRRIHGDDIVRIFHDGQSSGLSFAVGKGAVGGSDSGRSGNNVPTGTPPREARREEVERLPPPREGVFFPRRSDDFID